MTALGFTETDTGESWLLNPTAAAWEVLTVGRVQIQTGLATLPISGGAARNNTATAGVGSPAGFAAGLGELPVPGTYPGGFQGGGMGMGAGAGPDMAAIHRMAQDPAMMRTMMSDPTVQGMMRNNPQMGAAMQVGALDLRGGGGACTRWPALPFSILIYFQVHFLVVPPKALLRITSRASGVHVLTIIQ